MPPEPELKSAFAHVGDILQLKDNEVFSTQNTMMQSVPISYFAKIYSF